MAAFLAALEKREPRSAGYHARKVLALREGYHTADLLSALSHALAYGALDHHRIERILHARADRRRLDEYDALPCRGVTPRGETPCPSETT